MNLEDEIAIYRFAQGVHSAEEVLSRFDQIDEYEKQMRFMELDGLVWQLKPIDADLDQVIANSLLTDTAISEEVLKAYRSKLGSRRITRLIEGKFDQSYTLLLNLFKTAYQRGFTLGNPANWRYWDLSNPDVVQDIRTRQQALINEVYAAPSFRSEFTSIAKLWHEHGTSLQTRQKKPDPAPERQTHFHFLSYDEMISESIKVVNDKTIHGIRVLLHSMEKALAVRYGLASDDAKRVALAVIERHLRDTYNVGLFWGVEW